MRAPRLLIGPALLLGSLALGILGTRDLARETVKCADGRVEPLAFAGYQYRLLFVIPYGPYWHKPIYFSNCWPRHGPGG